MRPGRRMDIMKTLGKCDAGQARLMVNYRYWANSEWLQTGISAVKAGGTPPFPRCQHRTRKEDRHARRMDLTSTRGKPPPHGRPATGSRAAGRRDGAGGPPGRQAGGDDRAETATHRDHGTGAGQAG